MEKFPCPYCKHMCRSNAPVCPSCGLDFARWLTSYPGKIIPGWKPDSPPHDPDLPAMVDPSRLAGLSPDARAAAIMASMEAEDRRRHGPGIKAARRAGRFLLIMGVLSLLGGLLLTFTNPPNSLASMLSGYFGAALLVILAIGAYRGNRNCALAGAAFYALDIVISMTMTGSNALAATAGMATKALLILSLLKSAKDMD